MRTPALLLLAALAAAGCGERRGSTLCGISLLAAPAVVMEQFAIERQTLSFPPRVTVEELPLRFAAGELVRGLVGVSDSLLMIGVDQEVTNRTIPGFGVVITDLRGEVKGVMIFEGDSIPNAPILGRLQVGARSVPLHGVRMNYALIDDARCPIFPAVEPR